ncbi:hypothetical protein H9P43_002764 [Blastocladiella emersonii ATCC 22665]|nr:hypothetical protein H9P43_002764 [Blastocladiella emersonii ATCC 22665]
MDVDSDSDTGDGDDEDEDDSAMDVDTTSGDWGEAEEVLEDELVAELPVVDAAALDAYARLGGAPVGAFIVEKPGENAPLAGNAALAGGINRLHLRFRTEITGNQRGMRQWMNREVLASLNFAFNLPTTSGDTEMLVMPNNRLLVVAAAAKPGDSENREGNLIFVDLTARAYRMERELHSVPNPNAGANPLAPRCSLTVAAVVVWRDWVVSGGVNGTFAVSRIDDGSPVPLPPEFPTFSDSEFAIAIAQSPEAPWMIAVGDQDSNLIVFNLARIVRGDFRRSFALLDAERRPVNRLAFAGAHRLVAGCDTFKGTQWAALIVWDLRQINELCCAGTGNAAWRTPTDAGPLRHSIAHPFPIVDVAAVDGTHGPYAAFITAPREKARRTGANSGDQRLWFVKLAPIGEATKFSPRRIADPVVECAWWTGLTDCDVLGFSPCGRYAYAGGCSNRLVVIDVSDKTRALGILPHSDDTVAHADTSVGIIDAVWLRGSDLLATAGRDGVIRFWDIPLLHAYRPTLACASRSASTPVDLKSTRQSVPTQQDILAASTSSLIRVRDQCPFVDDVYLWKRKLDVDDVWSHGATIPPEALYGFGPNALDGAPPLPVGKVVRYSAEDMDAGHRPRGAWGALNVGRGLISRLTVSPDESILIVGLEAGCVAFQVESVLEGAGVGIQEVQRLARECTEDV